jgi:hypothetical protein
MALFSTQQAAAGTSSPGVKKAAGILILLGLGAPLAASARPCTCQDIPKIEETIALIGQTRAAWYSVLADILGHSANAPSNMDEAKKSFHQKMGWTSTRKVGGIDPNTGETVLDPQFQEENCDSIVNGVKAHENAHRVYNIAELLPVLFADQRLMAKILAESEIYARDKEEAFLKHELNELKKKCGTWRCKCTGVLFQTATACAQGCPAPSLACIAPTCLEIDPKTGKWTGKAY